MKRFALGLLWLALAKIALVEYLQRAALADAVRAAFETAALRACAAAVGVANSDVATWMGTARVRISSGDRTQTVALWDVSHPDWAARYRRTQIVIATASLPQSTCRYDTVAQMARVVSR